MSNTQIIFDRALQLFCSGALPGSGEELFFEDFDGSTGSVEIPIEINTAEEWIRRGFQIRDGQNPVDVFPIWQRNSEYYRNPALPRFRLLPAAFFSRLQVEPIR
ncbi:MAG: hypothetical protein Q4F31_09305 [Eubacteriales bacterium]|nr:hypothetical protein [Eubacteriales bacterium]